MMTDSLLETKSKFRSRAITTVELDELTKEFKRVFQCDVPSELNTEEMNSEQIEKYKALMDLSIYYKENFLEQLAFSKITYLSDDIDFEFDDIDDEFFDELEDNNDSSDDFNFDDDDLDLDF
ncbi:MAG: hypothetical protein J6A59_00600 [Lachnospiraceae bacterium]|nr:hypothetical protein [Lachnospiraceae bacterium]